jgi:hypothetical protein
MRDFVDASKRVIGKQRRAAQAVAHFRQAAARVIKEKRNDAVRICAASEIAQSVVVRRLP